MRATVIKLTAFIAVCLFFTIYLAFTIANIRPSHLWFFHRDYSLSATFDDVTGLNTGDNVKVAGVVVGKVRSIGVRDGRARVSFVVHKTVRLPSDTSAAVRWRNLLGQRYIYLYPGNDPTVLRNHGVIGQTRSVVDVGELFNRLGPIVKALDPQQVNVFLDEVTGALDGNQDKLRQSLDDLATLTASLAARDNQIGRLVTNLDTVSGAITARDQEIRTVLDNLLSLATTFSQNTNVVDEAVTDLGSFNTNLNTLLSHNQTQIGQILNNLGTLVQVVQAKLPEIDTALGQLPFTGSKVFAVGRFGDWLQQSILCLNVQLSATQTLTLPCGPGGVGAAATGTGSAPTAPGATAGAAAGAGGTGPDLPAPVTGIGNVLDQLEGR